MTQGQPTHPNILNCPTCGGPLEIKPGMGSTVRCSYCQNNVIIPEELRHQGTPELFQGTLSDMLLDVSQFGEIARLIKNNQKIPAIKLYRGITGQSLKESKLAIEKLERGESLQIVRGQDQTSLSETSAREVVERLPEILELVRKGNKIGAIKLYREISGARLKEAKEAVEALDLNPEINGVNTDQTLQIHYGTPIEGVKTARTLKNSGLIYGCTGTTFLLFIFLGVILFIVGMMMTSGGPLNSLWQRVNPFANYQESLSFGGEGTGPGRFTDLRSISLDNNGRVYAADYSGERVQVFDETGKFITQWAPANAGDTLYNLAADRQGNVYVAQNGEVYLFEGSTGKLLGMVEFGEQWKYIDDVIVTSDGGLVVIADGETIVRFDSTMQVTQVITDAISTVSSDSELDTRLAVDGLGNLYALGAFNSSVFKFAPDGRFITRFGSEGDEPGQISAANAIAVDGQGRVYVSDINGIEIFDSDGRFLNRMDIRGVAFGMTFNDQNELWIASNIQKVIRYRFQE